MSPRQRSYIRLHHSTYLARLQIPKDVQETFGKVAFTKSLKTSDKRLAERLAQPLVAQWQTMIDQARSKEVTAQSLMLEALREEYENATDQQKEFIEMEALRLAEESKIKPRDFAVVTGKARPIAPMIDSYLKAKEAEELTPSTLKSIESSLRKFNKTFKDLEELNVPAFREYFESLGIGRQTKVQRKSQIIGLLRFHGIPTELYSNITFKIAKKAALKEKKREAWSPDEVRLLLKESTGNLRDCIKIAAYSGMRINEIVSLRVEDVNFDEMSMAVVDGKTEAANRVVPIHPEILPEIQHRYSNPHKVFLFKALEKGKETGRRSKVLSKQFTNLKKRLGFGSELVFHSLRKTFVSTLHEQDVPVEVAKRIVGHAIQDITYGRYSEASKWPEMVEAVKKVSYPL